MLPLPVRKEVVGGGAVEQGDVALALHLQREPAVDVPLAEPEHPHIAVLHIT